MLFTSPTIRHSCRSFASAPLLQSSVAPALWPPGAPVVRPLRPLKTTPALPPPSTEIRGYTSSEPTLSPLPLIAIGPPPPPSPRRSCTCDGSSLAPGRNLTGASYLQVANRKRGHRRCEHERQEHSRPDEQRRARTMGAAERPELEHDLRKAGR